MFRINEQQFYQYLNQFIEVAGAEQLKEYGTPSLSFSDGFLYDEEGYKCDLAKRAHDVLDASSWKRSDIGTGTIISRIKKAFSLKGQNIVFWIEKDKVFEIIDSKPKEAEIVFFNLFCDGDDQEVFNAVVDLLGNKYAVISFLFFLKDPENYVPCKPVLFKTKFDKLGISTNSLSKCTWENYSEFIQILKWVQNAISPYFPEVSLIDAHSFVWMIWMLDKPKGSPEWFNENAQLPEIVDFCSSLEERRERFLDRFSKDKLEVMDGKELLQEVFSDRPSAMMRLLMFDESYRKFGAAGQYKYLGVIYQGLDGSWMYKETTHPQKMTQVEAEQKAVWIRDRLVYCIEVIERINVFRTIKDYEKLQNELQSVFFSKYPWALKYYQMLFPEFFPAMYADKTLDRALHIIGLPNHGTNSRILNAGELSLFIRRCDISNLAFNEVYSLEWGWEGEKKQCKNAQKNRTDRNRAVETVNTRFYNTPSGAKARQDDRAKEAETIDEEINGLQLEGREKEAVVKQRVNQGRFRDSLLRKYGKCCLCGAKNPALLWASHIKPWSDSEPIEKLDENNGLLLCPNHDRLFDKGLISFEDSGKIIISSELSDGDRDRMNVNELMRIRVYEQQKKYLSYHRTHIFKK